MENYLRAASQMVEEVTFTGPQPERIVRRYIDTSDRYRLEGGIDGDPIGHEIYNHYDIERGYWVTPQECGHVRIIGGTPFSEAGYYRLTFKVQSLYRDHPEVTAKIREYSPKRPHQSAIRILSPERAFPEIAHTVAIHDLPDNEMVDIDHEVWVPKDWRLQLYFENGPACPLWVLHQELIGWKEIPTPPGATEAERREIRKKNQAAEPKTPQSKEFLARQSHRASGCIRWSSTVPTTGRGLRSAMRPCMAARIPSPPCAPSRAGPSGERCRRRPSSPSSTWPARTVTPPRSRRCSARPISSISMRTMVGSRGIPSPAGSPTR